MITDPKSYCYGRSHKQRGNYPSGGWCRLRVECKGKCDGCVRVNGKESNFVKK